MKKILTCFCVLALVFTLIQPIAITNNGILTASAEDVSYTEVIVPSFINRDGEPVKITETSGDLPKTVDLGADVCVPTKDPSYFSLDCGIKYTEKNLNKVNNQTNSQILVEPMTYGESCGFLLYVKTPKDSSGVKPVMYIVYNAGDGSNNTSKYQYSGTYWYTLKSGDTAWQKATVSGYAPTLSAGFDGYIYIPFDAFKNNKLNPDWQNTDKICGLLLWDGTTAEEIIYSIPMFVKRGTLASNGLPTVAAVDLGDKVLGYFGEGSCIPAYYGEDNKYGKLDICRVKSTKLSAEAPLGPISIYSQVHWDGRSGKAEFIESTVAIADMPMVSTKKVTNSTTSNHWIGSLGIDASSSLGGEAAMFYVKLPKTAKGKFLRVDFQFDNTYNTYTHSGTFKLLAKDGITWQNVAVSNYFVSLPDGFEGYVMVPYNQIVGDVKPTVNNAITTMNLRITDMDGTEPVIFSAPIIVTNIGETADVLVDGITKNARNPFTGEVATYAEAVVGAVGYNPGDNDGNGMLDVRDLVRMKRVMAKVSGAAFVVEPTADMNGDSVADSGDLIALRQHILSQSTVVTDKIFLPLTSEGDKLLLANPDRGFRTHLTLYVKEAVDSGNPMKYYRDDFDVFFGYIKSERVNNALAYLYLTDYRNMDIPQDGMDAIEAFFKFCEIEQIKIMLRFGYCDDLNYLDRGANQETILRHIKQLAPLVAKYRHCIHTVEGGFVGSYGEWASVYQRPAVDYETVTRAIVENFCVPTGLFFSHRLPQYKNLIPETDSLYKYIAYNNDAMYGEQSNDGWHSGGYQYGTAEWAQVCNEGAYTPQGGEMLNNSAMLNYNAVPTGIQMIKETAHHWHNTMSVWHGMFEDSKNAIMNNWRKEVITPEILEANDIVYCPSWFKDDNGNTVTRYAYDFIRDHLGYKLEAQSFSVSGEDVASGKLTLNLALKNYGMSAAFCMNSSFVILDEDYNVVSKVSAGKPETWYSHNPEDYLDTTVLTHNINAEINAPKATGKYYIAFCLENTMGVKARFSNRIDVVNGYNILHEFYL
ncbi:MAG: DUF4874 domain-containing protein [Clostridia bacterium]|nr:DUF4874 domain-containing protein [Clostridia bacterium]